MANENEWLNDLETEVTERIAKRDLCRKFDIDWSESLGKFSFEQLTDQIKLRAEIARKYGQRLLARHFFQPIERYESFIANVAIKTETIPNKYSLNRASRELGIPIADLRRLRILGIINCERIGMSYFVNPDTLKKELKSPEATKFFAQKNYSYSP